MAVACVSRPVCQALDCLDARLQLGMVFAELIKCWGSIMVGKWPTALLGTSQATAGYVVKNWQLPRSAPAAEAGGVADAVHAPPPASAVASIAGAPQSREQGCEGSPRSLREARLSSGKKRQTTGLTTRRRDVAGPEAGALEGGDE